MIQTYESAEQYNAATKPTNESSVSEITDIREIKIDPVMVLTDVPKKGDIVCLDTNKKVKYFDLDSFSISQLPTGWQAIAFVKWVRGRKVRISRVIGNYKWAQYFLWKVTGYTMDGESHAFSFTVKVSGTNYTCEGNYSGTTVAEVAASMNTVVKNFNFGGHSYHVYVRGGEVILQHDTYTTYLGVTPTGVSVTAWVALEIPASSAMPRFNGQKSGDGSIINPNRSLIYFRADLASGTYNPATDVTSIKRAYPICLPAYLGTSANNDDHCAALRAYYGEGEDGWIKFMESVMAIWPSQQGVFYEVTYGTERHNTYALAGQKVEKADGTPDVYYPAFDAVAAVNFDCDGLRAGDWIFPNIGSVIELKRPITYPAIYQKGVGSVSIPAANADVYSRACAKLGMTQVSNSTSCWSSSRCSTSVSWYFHGGSGGAYGSYFFGAFQVVADALLTLPRSAE